MSTIKKHYSFFFLIIYFFAIFILSFTPLLPNFDIWFHIKSGEASIKYGIIHSDIFSYSAYGRNWFPYEWLFQIVAFLFSSQFGLQSILVLGALCTTSIIAILFITFRKILKLQQIMSYALCFFFLSSVYEFTLTRPHLFAYLFFITIIFLILHFLFNKKNLLLLSIPVTFLWTNTHASVVLDIYLFASFAIMNMTKFFVKRDRNSLSQAKILGIYAVLTTFITILPPLGLTQYRILLQFFQERNLLSHFITEWVPVTKDTTTFIVFLALSIVILFFSILTFIKKKKWEDLFWMLPLLTIFSFSFTASRNIFFGYFVLTFLIGWILSNTAIFQQRKIALFGLIAIITIFSTYIFYLKHNNQRFYYPTDAATFIQNNNIKGNMFNDFTYGGYLIYRLYPKQKVFIDGRSDVYLCCEIKEVINLMADAKNPDSEFRMILNQFWNKHNISYVVISTERFSFSQRIGKILSNDPSWNLVFWDDNAEIFLRNDGKNDSLIENFTVKSATPYNTKVYKNNKNDALLEYERMLKIADSSQSRNAIGYIYLQDKKIDLAEKQFEKAIAINPDFESPYMNLAEIAVYNGDYEKAIDLYQKAYTLNPKREFIQIRLQELRKTTNH